MGFSKGRLVSQFPTHWDDLVNTAIADAMPIQKKRITELICRLKSRLFIRKSEFWEKKNTWIENAISEHRVEPFRAILSKSNPGSKTFILGENDLDEFNKLWAVDSNITINRKTEEMANTIRLLLESAKEVIFVDPHFGPEEARYCKPLKAFLEILINMKVRVEYHTATRSTSDFLKESLFSNVSRIVPHGISLKIIRWRPHPELHNRYILTNKGGISFGCGLDEGSGRDEASLLSEKSYKEKWRQYNKATCPFEFLDGFEVKYNNVSQIDRTMW
jgi:hypothetical protein